MGERDPSKKQYSFWENESKINRIKEFFKNEFGMTNFSNCITEALDFAFNNPEAFKERKTFANGSTKEKGWYHKLAKAFMIAFENSPIELTLMNLPEGAGKYLEEIQAEIAVGGDD